MGWTKKLLSTPVVGDVTKKIVSMKVNHDAKGIAEHFTQFLTPEIADTKELKDQVFKIRHEVYCEELNFLKSTGVNSEKDSFDNHSLFSLIKHKPTGIYTSCVRVVHSRNEDELLPIEHFCMDSIQDEKLHPRNFPRNEICEISRLAVKADFRRRASDKFKGSAIGAIEENTYSETELRCFPFIAIGLYMASATMAIDTGINHVYVMMEPRLARSMKFVGIKFIQIGDAIEYHGKRAPYYINPHIFLENLSPGFVSLYQSIRDDICNQLPENSNDEQK